MPKVSKVIKIIITNGKKGQPISVRNRNTGDIITDKDGNPTVLQETAKAVVDLQNSKNSYTNGDVIDIMISGEVVGTNSFTGDGDKGESITISTSSITSGLSRGI